MNKRKIIALLALLLTETLSGPMALANYPLELITGSEIIEQEESNHIPELAPVPGEQVPEGEADSKQPVPEPSENELTSPVETFPEQVPVDPNPDPIPNGLPTENSPVLPETEGISTIEKLAEFVAQDQGGTISVTSDLILPEDETIYLTAAQPVIIELGINSITIPQGATLVLDGPITLTGTDAPKPLLQVSGFLITKNGAVISASGENAVAVHLADDGWDSDNTAVEAVGTNACAVEAEGIERLDLNCLQLTAKGENAVCVRSNAPVRLSLCWAESSGVLADVPDLTLDGTAASPEPESAKIIRRVAGPGDAMSENGLCIPVGVSKVELEHLLQQRLGSSITYFLYDSAGEGFQLLHVTHGSWSGEPVDLSRPGTYLFTGTPERQQQGAVSLPVRTIPVYVVEPSKPWIMDAERAGDDAVLRFFREIEGAKTMTLWYSVDGGENWQDSAASFYEGGAILDTLPLQNHTYLFYLEVKGGPMAGKSNVLSFAYYDNRNWNGGGDWDGGDWGDQGELPDDNPAPPPDHEPDTTLPEPPIEKEPEQEDSADASHDNDKTEEHMDRPTPSAISTPTNDLPKIEVSFTEPIPAPAPTEFKPSTETILPQASQESTPSAETILPQASQESTPSAETILPQPPAAAATAPMPTAEPSAPVSSPLLPEEATVSLTGRDLEAQKQANRVGVTLTENGLKATLPFALTDALNLGQQDVLSARLDIPEADKFEICFWVNGREITGFDGGIFTVTLAYDALEGTKISCADDTGTEFPAQSYAEGEVVFALSTPGLYAVQTAVAEPTAAKVPAEPYQASAVLPTSHTVWFFVAGGALLAMALLSWRIYMWRRGGR